MRPIDADVVIKHIEEYWEMVKLGKPSRGMTAVIQNIKTIINSLPTVDAIPVEWILNNERMPKAGTGRKAIMDMIEDWRKENAAAD